MVRPNAHDNGGEAAVLQAHVERIESLEAEKRKTQEEIAAAYAQAASEGLDKAGLKLIIKERQSDMEKTARLRVAADKMRKLLAGLEGTELGEWAVAFGAAQTSARNTRRPKAVTTDEVGTA